MTHKQLHFRTEAREKILKGVNTLADAVRITLGPKSKSVLIERPWGRPIVCNDGVTIEKDVELKDHEENLGAQMIREAAERTGLRILRKALEAPTRQIAINSGVDGGVVVEKMTTHEGAYGFDAAKNEYVDLIKAGIIDPTKVVRVALENAVSVAGTLLLTEATLTEIPEEPNQKSTPRENLM